MENYMLNKNDFWDSSFCIWNTVSEEVYKMEREESLNDSEGLCKVVTSLKGNEFVIIDYDYTNGEGYKILRKAPLNQWGNVDQCFWLLDWVEPETSDEDLVYAVAYIEKFTSMLDIIYTIGNTDECLLYKSKEFLINYFAKCNWFVSDYDGDYHLTNYPVVGDYTKCDEVVTNKNEAIKYVNEILSKNKKHEVLNLSCITYNGGFRFSIDYNFYKTLND